MQARRKFQDPMLDFLAPEEVLSYRLASTKKLKQATKIAGPYQNKAEFVIAVSGCFRNDELDWEEESDGTLGYVTKTSFENQF